MNAAERWLVQQWLPCFNVSLNSQPAPLPKAYLPPDAGLRMRRSLSALIR